MEPPPSPPLPDLTKYARQTVLPGIGADGQRRLLAAHAAIVGCGTLGCVIADQLCRSGVGRLTILDRDLVEPGNLQRQVLFDAADAEARLPKAEAAQTRLAEINVALRAADAPRMDLMLSGHTHGGQVRIPFIGTPIVPSRFGQKNAGGLVQGPRCPVFVSRGVGMSLLPVRLGVPPEIGLITLLRG